MEEENTQCYIFKTYTFYIFKKIDVKETDVLLTVVASKSYKD